MRLFLSGGAFFCEKVFGSAGLLPLAKSLLLDQFQSYSRLVFDFVASLFRHTKLFHPIIHTALHCGLVVVRSRRLCPVARFHLDQF